MANWSNAPVREHTTAQPVAAAIGMLRLSAQFAEPGWLRELFDGQPARFSPSAHADVEVQEAAAMAAFEACMALPAFQQAQPSACPDNEA